MIHLVGQIKDITAVACSGGPDSMAALSFIYNTNPSIIALHFDHHTKHAEKARLFFVAYCLEHDIHYEIGEIYGSGKPKEDSWEEYWRKQRYEFFRSRPYQIATAHHLNDVAETYLWGCIHGQPRFIHYQCPLATNVVRPFLLTKKEELVDWCHRHNVPYIEDITNSDPRFTRNSIRHNIIPEVEKINPGFLKVVARSLKEKLDI